MKLGYTIVYVPDVEASLRFFSTAFGFSVKFLHESGTYGELATGETTLAFAAHELGRGNFPGGHVAASDWSSRWAWNWAWSPTMWRPRMPGRYKPARSSLPVRTESHGGRSCPMFGARMAP